MKFGSLFRKTDEMRGHHLVNELISLRINYHMVSELFGAANKYRDV